MCGRFTLITGPEEMAEAFEADEVAPEVAAAAPRYNVAPTQDVLIVRMRRNGHRALRRARWGLVPSWSKDAASGHINARFESAASRPAFREAFAKRRCLVPANGFFEWKKTGSARQPYLIRFRDRRLFAFAGLWEAWKGERDADAPPLESCTILTVEPSSLVEPIHDRMPLILGPKDYTRWLDSDENDPSALRDLGVPAPPDEMEAVPVSTRVNRASDDDPACIEPVVPEEPAQKSLF